MVTTNLAELEELELASRIERISQLLSARQRLNGMSYYSPNPLQMRAHGADSRTILFIGGNRSGKSTFGAMELCYHLTRNYPSWFSKTRRFKKPIKAVVSCTSFPILNRVIEPKIKDLLPQDYYTIKRTGQGHLTRIECKDGSTVDFLTGEMDDMAYEGADWDLSWCDEPQQERKYQALLRGLVDRRGLSIITFTPLTEPWMKEKLVDKADGKSISLFQVNIRDNKFTMDGKAILSEDAIREFEAEIPDDVKETRIAGHFFHLRGLVYREFNEAHITHFSYTYPAPVICVLDPHDRNPHHLIWAYIDREDDIFVDYEMVVHCELDELAKKILTVEKQRGYKMKKRLIDPNFGRKPAAVGQHRSVIDELASHGTPFYEADDNIELGHMVVRDLLHYDHKRPLTAVNKPKLYFSPDRTPVTIRSMRNHQYDEWVGKTRNEKDPKEKQKDKETHGADCIRYLAMSRPTYRNIIHQEEPELMGAPY